MSLGELRAEMAKAAPAAALRFWKNGGEPALDAQAYEDAMDDLARSEARPGETFEKALARLADERDPTLNALYSAADMARALAEKRAADGRRDEATDDAERKRRIADKMDALAEAGRKEGESREKAYARLLRESEDMKALADAHEL
jgi:hypothetical protein